MSEYFSAQENKSWNVFPFRHLCGSSRGSLRVSAIVKPHKPRLRPHQWGKWHYASILDTLCIYTDSEKNETDSILGTTLTSSKNYNHSKKLKIVQNNIPLLPNICCHMFFLKKQHTVQAVVCSDFESLAIVVYGTIQKIIAIDISRLYR